MPLADDRLNVGSVIFEHVTDTKPPKEKYYIVAGITADKVALGTVYINSEINPNVFRTLVLRRLLLPILQSENPFLKYDSYIDCSQLQERSFIDVQNCLDSGNPKYGYVNTLPEHTMKMIIQTIDGAITIPPIIKKKYGIRQSE